MEPDPDDEHKSPRKATAEEIAAILTVPGEEFNPAALNVHHTRRLGVLKRATLVQEIEANMSRRSTAPKYLTPKKHAARLLRASDIRKPAHHGQGLPAPIPQTPAQRHTPASLPPPIANNSSTISAQPAAPLPRLTTSVTISKITRTAQQAAAQPRLPVGNTKTPAQGSGLLPAPKILQDRTRRVYGLPSASSMPTPTTIIVSKATPTVTVFKHGSNNIQIEDLCLPTSSPYPQEALTDSPQPIQHYDQLQKSPAWEPVKNEVTSRGQCGEPAFSPKRSKRQQRR